MVNRLRRKELLTAKRQGQILKAALAVFSRKGFGQSTVADVAQEAGTSVGTIYNYYAGKHDLLLSLITQNLILGNLDHIVADANTVDTDSFISALVEDRLQAGLANAQKILFLFFEIQRNSALRRQYSEKVLQPVLKTIETAIRKKVREGEFRHVDEAIMARTFAGIIIGITMLSSLEGKSSPLRKARTQQMTGELTNLLMYGLKRFRKEQVTACGK